MRAPGGSGCKGSQVPDAKRVVQAASLHSPRSPWSHAVGVSLPVREQAPDTSALRHSVVTCLRQWRPKLVETGFQELVFEDALEVTPPPCCLRRCLQCSVALRQPSTFAELPHA